MYMYTHIHAYPSMIFHQHKDCLSKHLSRPHNVLCMTQCLVYVSHAQLHTRAHTHAPYRHTCIHMWKDMKTWYRHTDRVS